jgi:two-component system LytT family response regulator
MKIRALTVEVEPLAREQIQFLLQEEPDVELIGTCAAGEPAIEFIRREHPGLVFLEPRLPDMDGLQVLRTMPQASPPVTIFTTSDDTHALRAFEAGAVDYLLKPFTRDRFEEAVRRARDCVQ